MEIKLYTLPTCGICKIIKKKLSSKNIPFIEYNLENYIDILKTNQAPILQVGDRLLNSPTEINNWINSQ